MRIDSNQLSSALNDAQPTSAPFAVKGNASTSAAGSASLGQDQTELSGIHVQIQALVAQAVQLPEAGLAKIEALRQAVLRGTYQPGPANTASALFDSLAAKRAA